MVTIIVNVINKLIIKIKVNLLSDFSDLITTFRKFINNNGYNLYLTYTLYTKQYMRSLLIFFFGRKKATNLNKINTIGIIMKTENRVTVSTQDFSLNKVRVLCSYKLYVIKFFLYAL